MIVTYSWLKELVDFDFTPEELSHRLTMAGLEVDFMEKLGEGLDSVIVARLDSVEKHPEADRLTVCQVNTGAETLQVVCGATNHKSGDLIAFAQVGTVLPGDFKIKKSKIRGEVSFGMLCSEKELGLAEESEGILILPDGLSLGSPVFGALGLKDVRFEIGLTPNRPDCLSLIGVAREVAAMAGSSLRLPVPELTEEGRAIADQTSVTIEDSELCPRYAARLIRGVEIGPSPSWLVRKLESIGQRSVNNVVDVTNYVLMELGHPLHAFDFNLLEGGRIVVRRAAEDEPFTTLDGQQRTLTSCDLTICDGQRAVALAGVMGGENSEIQPDTVDVLLESAYFQPNAIRRTSKRLGIHTESSHRFERGADVDVVPLALDRAAALIVEVAGGRVAPGVIDVYPKVVEPVRIDLSARRTSAILGIDIDAVEVAALLRSIGLEVEMGLGGGEGVLGVTVPAFRPDLEREIDLVEEVARLKGYEHIPVTLPQGEIPAALLNPRQGSLQRLREVLVGAGFSEVINYSFIAADAVGRLMIDADDRRCTPVRILNPLTEEQAVMRTSLVPSMLETVSRNLAYRSRDLRLFEARPVFLDRVGEELPEERLSLCAALCGCREPEGWAQGAGEVDFFDLKGGVEALLEAFNVDGVVWDREGIEPYHHPGKACVVRQGNNILGKFGEVHPKVTADFDIDTPLFLLELDLEAFFAAGREFSGFTPLSRFPDVYRDTALLLDEEVPAQEIFAVLSGTKVKNVEKITLFDLYKGKGIAPGKKSVAIRVRYRSMEKTLTDEEIQAAHGRLVKALCHKLNAEVR